MRGHDLRHNWITSHAEIGTPQSVLEAQAGHLSKRMSDHYKHISEGAARKASDELARVKAAQRAEARAKVQERATANAAVILAMPPEPDAARQTTVVHQNAPKGRESTGSSTLPYIPPQCRAMRL